MTGSNRPKQASVSLMDSQKPSEFSVPEAGAGAGRIGVWTGGADTGVTSAGGEVRRGASTICEGTVVTEGSVECAGAGAIVAITVDSLSSFLSKSRSLVGGWTSPLVFAGLLRATCSMHSTLAFWHLCTCYPERSLHIPEKLTFGKGQLCQRGRSALCAFCTFRKQTRFRFSLLLLPW
jgi:hypothetical protein